MGEARAIGLIYLRRLKKLSLLSLLQLMGVQDIPHVPTDTSAMLYRAFSRRPF
jgi:hypothetical protein